MLDVRLLKTVKQTNPPTGVKMETIRDEVTNKKCNHPPGGKCLNCLPSDKDKEKSQQPSTDKNVKPPLPPGKCSHGPQGKCFNCTPVDPKDKNLSLEKQLCQHGPTAKCLHCIDKNFINNVAHVSFDHWLA